MTTNQQLHTMDNDTLAAFAKYEQGRANDLQSRGSLAQRDADAARKELKRRKGVKA